LDSSDLGYKKEGFIHLFIPVGGGILWFCIFILALAVPSLLPVAGVMGIVVLIVSAICPIIPFVEGIIYFTRTEEEFQCLYVDAKRPWF